MKINVYFQTNGKEDFIQSVSSLDKAREVMNKKIQDMNFKSYYIRVNFENDTRVWIDYGSHTKFFIFELEDSKHSFQKLYNDSHKISVLKEVLENELGNASYCFYSYCEEAVCLEMDNDNYLVYIGERGQKHDVKTFTNIDDACSEVIHQLSESDIQENQILELYREEKENQYLL